MRGGIAKVFVIDIGGFGFGVGLGGFVVGTRFLGLRGWGFIPTRLFNKVICGGGGGLIGVYTVVVKGGVRRLDRISATTCGSAVASHGGYSRLKEAGHPKGWRGRLP